MIAINFRHYLCRLLVIKVFVGFSMASYAVKCLNDYANDYKYRVIGVGEFRANKSNASLDAAGKPKESFTYEANLYPNCEKTREKFGPTFTIHASARSASNEQVIQVSNNQGLWTAHVVDNEIKSVDRWAANEYHKEAFEKGHSISPVIRKLILRVYDVCHSSYAHLKGEGTEKSVNMMYHF